MRTAIAAIGTAALGALILFWGTDGLRAFTAETARRLAATERPWLLPTAIPLQTQVGEKVDLGQLRGRLVVAGFFYSHCYSTCIPLGMYMAGVRDELLAEYKGNELHFVSISFDPARDTPDRLRRYASRFNADPQQWWVVRPLADRDRLLDEFGVVAIPVDNEFSHNAAIYLIDRKGRLAGIYDWNAPRQVIAAVRERL